LIRKGSIEILLPKIYLQNTLFSLGIPASPLRIVSALAEQNRWRIALPLEISRFFMGRMLHPDVGGISTFFYDQPSVIHYDTLGLTLKPVSDERLLDLNIAGQAIWHHIHQTPPVSDKDLLRDARFAAAGWLSQSGILDLLVEDVNAGLLQDRELFLAEAIIGAVNTGSGVSKEAPADFEPTEHETDAVSVYDWWLSTAENGSIYLAALIIRGHPYIADGERLAHSSAIVWIDESLGWCRTRSRYYRLIGKRMT
jgi:hypothetical protein